MHNGGRSNSWAERHTTTTAQLFPPEVVDIVTCGEDSDLESVDSLDGCDSDEEVVHADNISTLLAQVSATASEQSENDLQARNNSDSVATAEQQQSSSDAETDNEFVPVAVARKRPQVSTATQSRRGRGRGVTMGRGRGRGGKAQRGAARFEEIFSPPGGYRLLNLKFTGKPGIQVPTADFKPVDYYKLF